MGLVLATGIEVVLSVLGLCCLLIGTLSLRNAPYDLLHKSCSHTTFPCCLFIIVVAESLLIKGPLLENVMGSDWLLSAPSQPPFIVLYPNELCLCDLHAEQKDNWISNTLCWGQTVRSLQTYLWLLADPFLQREFLFISPAVDCLLSASESSRTEKGILVEYCPASLGWAWWNKCRQRWVVKYPYCWYSGTLSCPSVIKGLPEILEE